MIDSFPRSSFLPWLLALTSACSPSLSSPPSHLHHFASPGTVGNETTAVSASVAGGGEVFGPSIVAAEVQVRHGLDDRTEIGGSVSVGTLLGTSLADPPHRSVYAARVTARRVLVSRVLTLDASLGGGVSAAGGYVSPDVGLTVGWENPIVTPYAFGSFLVSLPVTHRALNVQLVEDDAPDFREPFDSFGTQFGLGVAIPLGPDSLPFGSIFLEASALVLFGDDPFDDVTGIEGQRGIMTFGVSYRHYLRARGSTVDPSSNAPMIQSP